VGKQNDEAVVDQITEMVQKAVALKTGRRFDRVTARGIVDATIEMFFTSAVQTGYARLPKGFGSLHLRTLKPTRVRVPTGDMLEIKEERKILKYVEGLAVRDLLGKLDKHPGRTKPRTSAVDELFEGIEERTSDA